MKSNQEILITYAEADDQPIDGGVGWVSNFNKFLTNLLFQINKVEPKVRLVSDDKLTDKDLTGATVVIAVLSDSLEKTAVDKIENWAQGLHKSGKLVSGGISKFCKVLKTPIDPDKLFPSLSELVSYDFYFVDARTGEMQEFTRFFGSDAERSFWMKLVDISYDISYLLSADDKGSKKTGAEVGRDKTVYLASSGMDLLIQRDVIKRELKRHGYEVLPNTALPKDASELEKMVREDLSKCRLSIHMVGEDYGYRPTGSELSVVDIQNRVAQEYTTEMSEYNKKHDNEKPFSRLIWLSPDLLNVSERQRIFIEDIKSSAALLEEAEVLQIQLQELKAIIREELMTGGRFNVKREVAGYDTTDEEGTKVIYLITDKSDLKESKAIQDFLTKQGFKVLAPSFEGELVDIRYIHQENLRRCDGSIIYYGNATSEWIKTKLQDLLKAPGFGREKPLRVKAVYLEGKKEIDTSHFEKNKTLVLGNTDKFDPKNLAPFLTKLDN